jgi:hypothetical protein
MLRLITAHVKLITAHLAVMASKFLKGSPESTSRWSTRRPHPDPGTGYRCGVSSGQTPKRWTVSVSSRNGIGTATGRVSQFAFSRA